MITHDEIRKLAALAKLSLDEAAVCESAHELGVILDFAALVSDAADTAADDANGPEYALPALREDTVSPPLPADVILSNANETKNGFFVARTQGGTPHENT